MIRVIASFWPSFLVAALLAGCVGDYAHIVKVTTFPELTSTEFETLGPCIAVEYTSIPVERQWSNGYVSQGHIRSAAGIRRTCP